MAESVGPFGVEPGRPHDPDEEHENGDRAGQDDVPALPPPVAPGLQLEFLEVTEEQVWDGLRATGVLIHAFAAVDKSSDEWVFIEAELRAIVPPATRIINRNETLKRLAMAGDWPAVGIGLLAYGRRSIGERAAAIARRQAQLEAEPTADVPFEFGSGGA